MSTRHSTAAARFLKDREQEKWHDETLWLVRAKRDKMSRSLPEWETLRNLAASIKLYSNSHLADLLEQFEKNAAGNGAIVHWAKDAEEYNRIVYDLLKERNVKRLAKSKSMLAEECGMNSYLMERGIDVVETDLGERILQLMHLKPSHIVLPAIHIKRQQVGEMMEREMGTEKGNFDPTYLTHAARKNLREIFLNSDAAMTGVNFAVASTGEIVVCTNEGNADMGTSFPKLHIAAFGLEKIVPDLEALGVFTRLLARSGTGQPITSYTSHYRSPQNGGEFHIIIVDNGRSEILKNREHIRTLNCIRCGECMNTCPVYRRSGGYSYTYFIPGPIGINLSMLGSVLDHFPLEHVRLIGIHTHIGSQITDMTSFQSLAIRINEIQDELEARGITVRNINLGGGLGIDYHHPNHLPIPEFGVYFAAIHKLLKVRPGQQIHFEPGRSIVAQCGTLISRVLYVKEGEVKRFAILDAGFTELIRPAMYDAYHRIENISNDLPVSVYDVVGPICESSDVFARDCELNEVHRGDFIALRSAGAYGEVMASQYNCRKLPNAYFSDQL